MSTLSFFSRSSDNVKYHFHFYVSELRKSFSTHFASFFVIVALLQTKFHSLVSYTIPTSLRHFQSFTRIP
uniref:Putative ovule protein n=1 Tax=Solanum chacoense TaxID=4108 RepID=A0A0V0H8Q6_SOLCH